MEFTSWESMESHKVEEIYYPDINQILPKRFIPNLPLVSNQFAFLKVDTALDLQEKYGSLGLHFNLPHL